MVTFEEIKREYEQFIRGKLSRDEFKKDLDSFAYTHDITDDTYGIIKKAYQAVYL